MPTRIAPRNPALRSSERSSAGCASAPSRFYTLAPTATAVGAPSARYAIVVGPVSIPAEVDRPEFVVQVAPNRVEIDEFNRWASPLNDGIARAVAGNLSVLLGTPHVATALVANATPACRITIDVQRFESIPGEAVLVEAIWAVRKTAGGEPRAGRTHRSRNRTGPRASTRSRRRTAVRSPSSAPTSPKPCGRRSNPSAERHRSIP